MHIAIFLATSGHSGVDRVMSNLIRGLASQGHRVDLLQIKGHGPYLKTIPKNIHLVQLKAAHALTSLFPVINYLRTAQPDCLLTDKDKINRISLFAKFLTQTKTRHVLRMGTTVSKNLAKRGLWSKVSHYLSIRLLYPLAEAIITPSYGAAVDLQLLGHFPKGKIKVVTSPVVDEELMAQGKEPVSHPWLRAKDRPVVLGIGELCGRKDFSTLIRAFAWFQKEVPSRLIILGKGKQRAKLQGLVQELHLADLVDFPGFVQNPYAYLARSDLFVLSSTCEGAPVVLIEALAFGLPIVSTDCPSGPREILDHGRFGLLTPVQDPLALAQAMLQIWRNPLDPDLIRKQGQRYSITRGTEEYLRVLG